jgi:hypothetical protein
LEQAEPGSRDQLTVREELAAIARETAIEILGPVVRNATKQAAKYAITRGPEIMARNVAPRVRDTVLPAIEDAGGPGALARGALSNVSDRRAGLLSKAGLGHDRGNGSSLPGTEGWRVPVEESVDVAVPLETAYEQFSDFEDFANFISQGEKTDERPNERIEWRSANGIEANGVITFHRLSDRLTRVMVTYDAQPQGIVQKAVSALRMSHRALRTDLMRYKAFVEMVDEDDVAELAAPADEAERDSHRKRPAARRGANGRASRDNDEQERDSDSDEEPDREDDESAAPARSTRRRAPASRSRQKSQSRQRR